MLPKNLQQFNSPYPKMVVSERIDRSLDLEEDDYDLDGFIVSEEEEPIDNDDNANNHQENENDEELQRDRMLEITSTLKPNETHAQKVLKAHISILVSALGGPDHTSTKTPRPYKLGLDALACLKDIKRWIKAVDERQKSFDVAMACFESGLVVNDLVVILCQWDSDHTNKKPIKHQRAMERVMLACLELLVLLTWPLEINQELSENQRLYFPTMKKNQIVYKKHILSYNKGQCLKAVIRLVLSTLSKNRLDREPRDNAILRLVLFFIRNVLNIEPASSSVSSKARKQVVNADNLPTNITYDDISLNTVFTCFKKNKVLMFLLTIANSLGTDFDKETFAQPCLECIFLLIKGVKVNDLLNPETRMQHKEPAQQSQALEQQIQPVSKLSELELQDLLKEESRRKKCQIQNISTRHGRFGSLLSIRNNDTAYVVSGQEALLNTNLSLAKLDDTKKWTSRPQFKYDSDEYVRAIPEFLNGSVLLQFKEFIEEFLNSGSFNKLIESIAWIMSGSNDLKYVDSYEKAAYFLTLSWFFNYKRERTIQATKNPKSTMSGEFENLDYGSVGAGLSEVNFILIVSYFRESFELRNWNALHVAMICFRELLLIAHFLFSNKSKKDENGAEEDRLSQSVIDRELAEGIVRKLFTFNDLLNKVVSIPQAAYKHSPEYLSVCVSVVHILLKSFESFANENLKLYVQTKRKQKKNKVAKVNNLDQTTERYMQDIIDGSDDEYENERIKEITKERRFDFQATELRFFHTSTVSTYIYYLSRFEDLSYEEIKKCLSYFHRLFVVRKDFTGLYRLDFMHTLLTLRNSLPRGTSIRKHVDEFITYFMKKFKDAFSRFPNPIEVLFPRFEDAEVKTFLGTGEVYAKPEKGHQPTKIRIAKSLEFIRPNFSLDDKIKILVTILIEQEKEKLINWLVMELDRIIKDRELSQLQENVSVLDSANELKGVESNRKLLLSDLYFRLLVSLVGFELPYLVDETCDLDPQVETDHLKVCSDLIKNWFKNQPVTIEDGRDASFFLRAKESDDYFGESNYYDENDEAIAFETEVNENTERRNFSELDALDALEAALEDKTSSSLSTSSHGSKGVARIKRKKRRSKNNIENESTPRPTKPKKLRSSRKPPSFNVTSDDEAPIKSSEYVHDSDDDSDNEGNTLFFEREETLRKLLLESGGILNAQQLNEFKFAWSKLISEKNPSLTARINSAVQKVSAFDNNTDQTKSGISNSLDSVQNGKDQSKINGSDDSKLGQGVGDTYSSDNSRSTTPKLAEHSSISSITPEYIDNVTNTRKRALNELSESENEDSNSKESLLNSRRKRIVLSDDDDDDDE